MSAFFSPAHVLVLLLIGVWSAIGWAIGHYKKGRPVLGFSLGLILGLIGIVIIACVPATHDHKVKLEREKQQIRAEAHRWN